MRTQYDLKDFQDKIKGYYELVAENKNLRDKTAQLPEKFIKLVEQNKRLIQETADMHYNLGVFYTERKKYKQAAQEFLKAVEIKPDDATSNYNLGFIYAEYLKNKPKAIEHFKQYLWLSKGLDKDADKARKYILIWETYDQKVSVQ